MTDAPPFALFIRGPKNRIFEISDALGFEAEMTALAVSIFEDSADILHVQALYKSQAEADVAHQPYRGDSGLESFVTQLEDEDWVSKSQQGLPPVIAGPFCVFGEHDRNNLPADILYPIQIEAGLAFGTGHHGTTKGCLLALHSLLESGKTFSQVLDLGAGAGTLAIAYAKALNAPVLATDIDPDAVDVTRENAVLNGVERYITAVTADGFDHAELKNKTFDLIFANILAEPLMVLAPEICNALTPGGTVILSGILDEKAGKVTERFETCGLQITPQLSVNGWTNLVGTKAT